MKRFIGTTLAALLLATAAVGQSPENRNSPKLFSATPLMDLGTQTYKGFEGGLYPNGSDTIPAAQATAGAQIASTIQPLDTNGNPDPNGMVVFTSIGMSNASLEFGRFEVTAQADPEVNKTTLAIVNGALAGITACYWVVPTGPPPCSLHTENPYDQVLENVLTPAGLTEQQVQVVWIKQANGGPGATGCGADGHMPCNSLCVATKVGCENTTQTTEAVRYEQQLGEIIRAAKVRWPNLKLAFVSSRIYAGYATADINPEPYAYEYGFSTKWLIQAQITQMQSGTVDPIAGDLDYNDNTAPWVAWGPYLWADGPIPRSDGLIWCDGQKRAPCSGEVDFQSDGTHPSDDGSAKVATMLLNFFLNSPYTQAWFAAAP
jgi:hypothetical protein